MNKIKKILIALISISVTVAFGLLIFIMYRILSGGNEGIDDSISSAVSIFGIVSGISTVVGLLKVVFEILSNTATNIRSYYESVEKEDIAKARHLLYKYRDFKAASGVGIYTENCDFDAVAVSYSMDENLNVGCKKDIKDAASKIANFYQMWGFLYKNGSLPIWIFKTSTGYNLLRLYDSIEDIIEEKQKKNPLYAEEFIELCDIVKKKYNHILEPSEYKKENTEENTEDTKETQISAKA